MRMQMMTNIMNCAKCRVFEKERAESTVVFHCGNRANGPNPCGPFGLGNNNGCTD